MMTKGIFARVHRQLPFSTALRIYLSTCFLRSPKEEKESVKRKANDLHKVDADL